METARTSGSHAPKEPELKRVFGTNHYVIRFDYMLRDIITTSFVRNAGFVAKLLLGVVVARMFGPDGKGLLVAFFLVPEFISTIGGLSINEAFLYWLARKGVSRDVLMRTLVKIAFLWVPLLVCIEAGYLLFFDYKYSWVAFVLCLALLPVYLLLEIGRFSLRGLHEMRTYNLSIIFETYVPLAFVAIVLFQKDIWWFLVGQSCGLAAALVLVARKFVVSIGEYSPTGGVLAQARDIYTYGLKVHVFRVMNVLDARIAALVISAYLPLADLGNYSVAITLSLLLQIGLQEPVSTVILPRLANVSESTRLFIVGVATRSMFFLSMLYFLLLVLVGKWLIVSIFGDEFGPAYVLSLVLIIGKSVKTPMATLSCYFKSRGLPERIAKISMRAAPISVVLSIALIPLYGTMGAAVATVAANLVFVFFMIREFRKETGVALSEIVLLSREDILLGIYKLKGALTGMRQ